MSNNPDSKHPPSIEWKELMASLNYSFRDLTLLQKALTHRSFAAEKRGGGPSHGSEPDPGVHYPDEASRTSRDNERLEFLGDAVLDLIITDLLWRLYPEEQEGALSMRRADLVSEGTLAELAAEIGLRERLLLGKGERRTGGAEKPRLIASALEALIGAVYLDSDYQTVYRVVQGLFEPRLQRQGQGSDYRRDYKTLLQEVLQKDGAVAPRYELEEELGPPHDRQFKVSVHMGERILAYGEGKSKKQAEQQAAQKALEGKTYESV